MYGFQKCWPMGHLTDASSSSININIAILIMCDRPVVVSDSPCNGVTGSIIGHNVENTIQ